MYAERARLISLIIGSGLGSSPLWAPPQPSPPPSVPFSSIRLRIFCDGIPSGGTSRYPGFGVKGVSDGFKAMTGSPFLETTTVLKCSNPVVRRVRLSTSPEYYSNAKLTFRQQAIL